MSSGSTTVMMALSTLAAPFGMADATAGPGVSGPDVDPDPSGSTFSFPFSGFSPSLVMTASIRSLFFLLLTSSAYKLVELILLLS